jgi:hypothetical protein
MIELYYTAVSTRALRTTVPVFIARNTDRRAIGGSVNQWLRLKTDPFPHLTTSEEAGVD